MPRLLTAEEGGVFAPLLFLRRANTVCSACSAADANCIACGLPLPSGQLRYLIVPEPYHRDTAPICKDCAATVCDKAMA